MTKNILNTALVLVGAGGLLTGCNFEQPEVPCFVQDSPSWAIKYDPVDDPACADRAPPAELVGVYKFFNPHNPAQTILALRPAGLASLGARDTTNPPSTQTATGSLALEPDAEDFCRASSFTEAKVNAAATATAAAVGLSYVYDFVGVYSAPDTPGTQLRGAFTYTRNGCASKYEMRGLWPAIGCDPESDVPAENCGAGSGLNPDFAAVCDPDAHFCVPEKAIPSFNANKE